MRNASQNHLAAAERNVLRGGQAQGPRMGGRWNNDAGYDAPGQWGPGRNRR